MPAEHPEITRPAQRALEMAPPTRISGPGGLLELLGALFHCMVGPPMAYIEIPLDWDEGSVARAVHFTYVTLGYTVGFTDLEYDKAEAALAQALWQDFKTAYLVMAGRGYSTPLLFWRLEPTVSEKYERGPDGKRLKVRCRVLIPGFDLTKLSGYHAEGTVIASVPEQQEVSGGNTTQAG